MHDILQPFARTLTDFVDGAAHFAVRLLTAFIILVVGWVCAAALRSLTRKVLEWLHFRGLLDRAGATDLLVSAHILSPERAVAAVVFWIVWLAILLSAIQTLGIVAAGGLVGDLARYVPRLASAIGIGVVGVFLSNLAWRATLVAAVNARLPAAKLVGAMVRALALVATVAMALEQLQVGENVLLAAFAISFGALMLAGAIAFGLGGRHLARRYLEERLRSRHADTAANKEQPSHL